MELFGYCLLFLFLCFILTRRPKKQKHKGWSSKGQLYADVFVYDKERGKNGYQSHTPTYSADNSFYETELVVVNYKGKLCAGRIMSLYPDRPEGVPDNVEFKPVLKRLEKSDLRKISNYGSILQEVLEKEPL